MSGHIASQSAWEIAPGFLVVASVHQSLTLGAISRGDVTGGCEITKPLVKAVCSDSRLGQLMVGIGVLQEIGMKGGLHFCI